MKVGSRQSSNYYRVSEKKNGLEFELEIKNGNKKRSGKVGSRVFIFEPSGRIRRQIIECYTDWLVSHWRKTSKKQNSRDSLVTSYLETNNFNSLVEAEYFFKLLQFLSFIRDLKGSKLFVVNQGYYMLICYSEAHDRAQSRFDGAPWEDQFYHLNNIY